MVRCMIQERFKEERTQNNGFDGTQILIGQLENELTINIQSHAVTLSISSLSTS
jgi:hypothetical protein